MDLQIYNSKDLRFKKPYGAVPSGTQVRFTLRPLRMEGFSRGVLRARFEFRDNETVEIPLLWEDVERERDIFTAVLDTISFSRTGFAAAGFRTLPAWWVAVLSIRAGMSCRNTVLTRKVRCATGTFSAAISRES